MFLSSEASEELDRKLYAVYCDLYRAGHSDLSAIEDIVAVFFYRTQAKEQGFDWPRIHINNAKRMESFISSATASSDHC